jgi:hypothetical protein
MNATFELEPARERAHIRRVRRSVTSTDIIAQERIRRRLQHQPLQQERTFQQAQPPEGGKFLHD